MTNKFYHFLCHHFNFLLFDFYDSDKCTQHQLLEAKWNLSVLRTCLVLINWIVLFMLFVRFVILCWLFGQLANDSEIDMRNLDEDQMFSFKFKQAFKILKIKNHAKQLFYSLNFWWSSTKAFLNYIISSSVKNNPHKSPITKFSHQKCQNKTSIKNFQCQVYALLWSSPLIP